MFKKAFSICVFSIILLIFNTSKADEVTTWVPISLGGITFFVTHNESNQNGNHDDDNIADNSLRACIDQAKSNNNWTYDYEVTTLSCYNRNPPIETLEGIETLINLEIFYVGKNNLDDLSPLSSSFALKKLDLGEYDYSNQFDDNDFSALSHLDNLEELVFEVILISSAPSLYNINGSGFFQGFNNLKKVAVFNLNDTPCSLGDALWALVSLGKL